MYEGKHVSIFAWDRIVLFRDWKVTILINFEDTVGADANLVLDDM